MEKKKKILLGVCGSIAAYKAVELNRRLIDAGYEVSVIMTPSALNFTAKLPFQIFNGEEPLVDMFTNDETSVKHVELANEADLFLVCAATANTIAKFNHGVADNFLTTVFLARDSKRKTAIVPAMNTNMWNHPATVNNVETLQNRDVQFWGPTTGKLACGEGEGRMIDVEEIIEKTANFFHCLIKNSQRVVITAGATREYIDPIRYISNGASGKTGVELAKKAFEDGYGACIIGKVSEKLPSYIQYREVNTSQEMEEALSFELRIADVLIMTAAVGDYTPVNPSDKKIKKTEENLCIEFTRSKDLVTEAKNLFPRMYIVGFCAETNDLVENAMEKIKRKDLDMMCANLVTDENDPFGADENRLILVNKDGDQFDTGILPKSELADVIIKKITEALPCIG